MSIVQIEKLRKERQTLVEKYKKELEAVKKDDRISESYREEKVKTITENLQSVKQGHEMEIRKMVKEGKEHSLREMDKAEFAGMDEKELIQLLIIENRNRDIASLLVNQFKDDLQTLVYETNEKVESNSSSAPGYINALKKLSVNEPMLKLDIDKLEQTYKWNNMNGLQKDYYKDFQKYEEQEKAYQQETEQEKFMEALGVGE